MRLVTYIISGLIFLFAIAGTIYILEPSNYSLQIFDSSLELPVALWAIVPAFLLFLVSIFHIAFYSTKIFMRDRKWLKDFKELRDALYWGVLKEPKRHLYSTEQMRSIANLLNVSKIELKEPIEVENEKLSFIVGIVQKIKAGEYINLRDLGLDVYLSKDNQINVQNNLNRLEKESEFAKTVLAKKEAYGEKVVNKAIDIAIEEWDFEELTEYRELIDREKFYKILDLVDDGKKDKFSIENLKKFIDYEKFECQDFIRVTMSIIKRFPPDTNLSLAKEMAKNSPKAENSYLLMLFEYEMRDSIKRFFEEHDDNEFKIFRLFETIKSNGYPIKIEELINYHTVCK